MPGTGRNAGGMSGGARVGAGRKKTRPGPTRKEKRIAKEAVAAALQPKRAAAAEDVAVDVAAAATNVAAKVKAPPKTLHYFFKQRDA